MMKKILQFLLITMLICMVGAQNVFAQSGPTMTIGTYENQVVAKNPFSKPTVIIMDGNTNVTGQYTITYGIKGQSALDVIDVDGTPDTDSRGIAIFADANTGTTVEKNYGNVVLGTVGHYTVGKVKITINAVPKVGSAYTQPINQEYEIHINGVNAIETFTPSIPIVDGNEVLTLGTSKVNNQWDDNLKYLPISKSPVPEVRVSTTVIGGKSVDITDHYTITVSYSDAGQTDAGLLKFDPDTRIIGYEGKGNQYQGFPETDINAITAKFPGYTGKLTYTLTPKTEYAGTYTEITHTVDVKISLEDLSVHKQQLHLDLSKLYFTADNVTGSPYNKEIEGSGYIMHVTKYSHEADKYRYLTPNPAILTEGGMQLPVNGGSRNTGGAWGDFLLYYEIEDQYNYTDSCNYDPFHPNPSAIIKKGSNHWNNVGGTYTSTYDPIAPGSLSANQFQTNVPGLAKIKVYAVLDGSAKLDLRNSFQPIMVDGVVDGVTKKVPKTQGDYTFYTEPVVFYVDVMKRIPDLKVSPDPSTIKFAANQDINWTEDFEVSGYRGTTENSYEGWLKWGAGVDASWEGGFEVDHFAYTFFIPTRDQEKITVVGWPGRNDDNLMNDGHDEYRFLDYQVIVDQSAYKGAAVNEGDMLFMGIGYTKDTDADGEADIIADEYGYVMVTDANKADLIADRGTDKLKNIDKIPGISYFSGKGYGNFDNAHWSMKFVSEEEAEQFQIAYTIRPWNHTRWDIGSSEQGTTFYTFNVSKTISTKIDLSYYFTTATKNQEPFDEPTAKVVAPSVGNKDVTEHFPLKYMVDGTEAMTDPEKIDAGIIESEGVPKNGNYYKDATTGTIVSEADGVVKIGGTVGNVRIKVWTDTSSWKDDAADITYTKPDPAYYTIRIAENLATWEIISTCKTYPCDVYAEQTIDDKLHTHRWDSFTAHEDPEGRFHILTAGDIYGGTTITGVPGIKMTIGSGADATAQADWESVAGASTVHCCSHETTNAVIEGKSIVQLDDDDIPTAGTFYRFEPTTNGFLTFDGRLTKNHNLVLIDAGTKIKEEHKWTDEDHLGDITFVTPLQVGHTYYLYDLNGTLRMHGFAYQPAYIMNATTTKAQSETPIEAYTFLNGLSSAVPTIINGETSGVTFNVTEKESSTDMSSYVTANANGSLSPLKMTIDTNGAVFSVRINAAVASTDASLGNCVTKYACHDLKIIDIPTYSLRADGKDSYGNNAPSGKTTVTTTNIATAITMTWGAWNDKDSNYDGTKNDSWSYKSVLPADRIGNETGIGDDEKWNPTIDGFRFFSAASQNPVDERNMNPQTHSTQDYTTQNNGRYNFKSGTQFEYKQIHNYKEEGEARTDYNTTYRIPARGAVLKFEPEESGTLLLYLVQNGSVDYFPGKSFKETDKPYQVKWRPLYITDETGRPVEMVNDFGNIGDYLPSGTAGATHAGSFTLGLSRCDVNDDAITEMLPEKEKDGKPITIIKAPGCTFDWSEFRGTKKGDIINGEAIPVGQSDQEKLIAAWPLKGEREDVIRLFNGGFALAHKAYVRYTFKVMAGKTYFVFQPGSKFEFGGFSFVPTGYPDKCKYTIDSHPARTDAAEVLNINAAYTTAQADKNLTFKWDNGDITATGTTQFTEHKENVNVTIDDRRNSSTTGEAQSRNFTADKWQSICLPFSVNETQCTKLFGENYVLLTCDGAYDHPDGQPEHKNTLHFVRHANRYIEAGRPYIFKPTKPGTFTFNNVTIEGEKFLTEDEAGTVTRLVNPSRFNVSVDGVTGKAFTFRGTYCRTKATKGSLIVGADGLGYYASDKELGGYRAFFDIYNDASAKSVNFVNYNLIDFAEDESGMYPTGIICIDNNSNDGQSFNLIPDNSAVYDINGIKLSDDLSGFRNGKSGNVYIINGKKYIK